MKIKGSECELVAFKDLDVREFISQFTEVPNLLLGIGE